MASPSTGEGKNVYLDTHFNIKGKLLTHMEEVRLHAQTYQNRGTRDAQNAEMLIQCLKASISRTVYNKV